MPNETLFELLNVIAVAFVEVVPPEKFTAEIRPAVLGTVYEAVILELPLMPNEIPFESLKTTVPVETLCVPADIATPPPPATDAVIVPPLMPKLTPLLFENVTAVAFVEVVPAEKFTALMSPAVLGTVYEAVILVEPLKPKLIPLLSEKTIVPLVAVCVPAASAPGAVLCE
jgi:hypothetical protein